MAFTSDRGKHLRVDDETQGLYTTNKPRRFRYETALQDDVWSDAVLIPRLGISSISYDLDTTGTANVQVTISSVEEIQEGTAVWREVPDNVRINTSVTAVRGKATGATGTFIVVAL